MAEICTVTTLRSKRAEILASIAQYEKRIAQARADLSHVNACIALFEATGEPSDINPYVDTHRLFARGEMMRLCKDGLASGPKSTKELALYVMAAKGLDTGDKVLAACRTESFHILGIVENGRFRLPWRFDLAALAPVDPANRPLSIAVHRAPGLPRPRQAGARTNIRFRFQAIVTRPHSPRTFSSPRSEN